jgi:type II secretory pathway pseudopilin PulG
MEQMIAVMGILSAAAVPGCQTFMARGKPSRAMLPYGGCG